MKMKRKEYQKEIEPAKTRYAKEIRQKIHLNYQKIIIKPNTRILHENLIYINFSIKKLLIY